MTAVDDTRAALFDAGKLFDGGASGVYHRSFGFEQVLRGVEQYVSHAGRGETTFRLHLAPVQVRSTLERSGYLRSFPNLVGVVAGFDPTEAQLGALLDAVETDREWVPMLEATDLSLTSAACHGLYPLLAGSPIPAAGARHEVQAWCFRHEPSPDPARMQSFRQHEFVYVGSPDGALEHRDQWRARAASLLGDLGIELEVVVANDPFFGRPGRLLAASQRQKTLKFELVAQMSSEAPGAICSSNYHEDHLATAFGLRLDDGTIAHTACVGFGLERITLALLWRHGLHVDAWPSDVRARLGLDAPRRGAPTP